jgi:hypothetical protein
VKLVDLLDELRNNVLRDASTLKSGPPDHYWDDATLVRYINEAQQKFARRTLCIKDDVTPEVVEVVLAEKVRIYTLHPSILYVTSARHEDGHADMMRATHSIVWALANPFTDSVDWSSSTIGAIPLRFTTDEGLQVDDEHQIRFAVDPLPDAKQKGKRVFLRVSRLPLESFVVGKTDVPAEIPEDWQLDMLEWAAWRALRNWDLDAEDRKKANQHKDRFDDAVKECRHEVEIRKMHAPPTWSFGQGGFTYPR